ncbi:hypothetical protein SLS62_005849 [Diatrype stigma]|uniref:DnaJ-domain-containing protein n=1 Tax=Diatrype stigma TaxID=117547 RepID=A0AAN9YPE2_9PEZI
MGAEQSSNRGAADKAPQKTDYYELLGVDSHAGDDEIKKAYRKKALELHPDRNYGDVERATQRFAEVQAAYEVLSDPQERAWYDSHHDAILRGDDPTDADAAAGPQHYHNVRLTTADEIYALIGRFNKTVPLDDSPGSFFTVLRETFERIADAEYAAAADSDDPSASSVPEYPSFGTSQDGERTARAFYGPAWQHFSTRLGFAWRDRWRLADAPDRRVRRLMEKENRKAREDAAREYADAVRALVAFVRKRDPRSGAGTGGSAVSEAERQKVLREAAAAQAARSRAAHQEKLKKSEAGDAFVVPEWARSRGEGEGEGEGRGEHDSEFATEEEEESEVEHFECVVCGKIFKSEKQYEAHEKSKKHIKAVQQLRRQMRKENANLDLDQDRDQDRDQSGGGADGGNDDGAPAALEEEEPDVADEGDPSPPSPSLEEDETAAPSKGTAATATPTTAMTSDGEGEGESEHDDDIDDDYASRDAVEARLTTGGAKQTKVDDDLKLAGHVADISLKSEDEDEEGESQVTAQSLKKMGKAKAKREKKAARQAAEAVSGSHTCTGCNASFDSKTKLFKHLDESGHAALKTAGPASSNKSSKKKKRR